MFRVRQTFAGPRLDDIPAAVRTALARLDLGRRVRPGQSVALTAGSRGPPTLAPPPKGPAQSPPAPGARPSLVPAMGSHGGATAEGQQQILESYGITEAFVGAPIRSSMEVVEIGRTPEGWPVY